MGVEEPVLPSGHAPDSDNNEEVVKSVPYHRRTIRNYMTSIPILLCCLTSGLVDSAVFNAWGVFATMQTGNTIILALGASQQPANHPRAWLQALSAIAFFFLGALFHARTTRALGRGNPLQHIPLSLSFSLQSALLLTSAALIQSAVVPGILRGGEGAENEPWITLVPLPMLAFQAGMQSVTARQLGFNEIPTTVLTSCFCDLGNDPKLFVGLNENWQRNRRILSVVAILLGGIIGGWMSRTDNGMPTAIWFAAAIKGSIALAWVVWKDEVPKEGGK